MTDSEQLDLFVDRVAELSATRLARSGGLESSFSIKFDQSGTKFSISNPDEDDLRSYLLTYRQFISAKDPVFVDKIHATLWRAFDAASHYRTELAHAQASWRRQCRSGMIALSIDGRRFHPALLQDLWINGIYFTMKIASART